MKDDSGMSLLCQKMDCESSFIIAGYSHFESDLSSYEKAYVPKNDMVEPLAKCSILAKVKEGEDSNRRNT